MEIKNGFIAINKEKGCTSHDCVKQIRKLLGTKKVGHTGTLDPDVTGTLPIAIGSATRFIQYLPCLLYTSDAADEEDSVDLGGRRIIKKSSSIFTSLGANSKISFLKDFL